MKKASTGKPQRRQLKVHLYNTYRMLPTLALSRSGSWVAGLPASQPVNSGSPVAYKVKTGDNLLRYLLLKNPCVMTSYAGIIRIRLKGRSSITSSQPAFTSSPVFTSLLLYSFII